MSTWTVIAVMYYCIFHAKKFTRSYVFPDCLISIGSNCLPTCRCACYENSVNIYVFMFVSVNGTQNNLGCHPQVLSTLFSLRWSVTGQICRVRLTI